MPDEERYQSFISLLSAGRRAEATAALKSFIQSFDGEEDCAAWTRQFLAAHRFGERIRHELYAKVIFPVLRDGHAANDAWCLYWLAGSSHNLYAADLWLQVDYQSPLALLRRAYAIDPGSDDIRRQLLLAQLDLFAHAAHEWPAGILNGMNGASAEDCAGYLADVNFARTLGPSPEQAAFLADFEKKVLTYSERLRFKT